MDTLEISISSIERVVHAALKNLKQEQGPTVKVDQSYFWFIRSGQLHDMDSEPSDFTIGSTSEVVAELERIAQDPEMFTSYALIWLSQAFREIGEAVLS